MLKSATTDKETLDYAAAGAARPLLQLHAHGLVLALGPSTVRHVLACVDFAEDAHQRLDGITARTRHAQHVRDVLAAADALMIDDDPDPAQTPSLPAPDSSAPPLTTAAAAELLGCTPRNVQALAARGSLPRSRKADDGTWQIDPQDLEPHRRDLDRDEDPRTALAAPGTLSPDSPEVRVSLLLFLTGPGVLYAAAAVNYAHTCAEIRPAHLTARRARVALNAARDRWQLSQRRRHRPSPSPAGRGVPVDDAGDWLTTAAAAELLGCTPRNVLDLIDRGVITRARRRGRAWLVAADDVAARALDVGTSTQDRAPPFPTRHTPARPGTKTNHAPDTDRGRPVSDLRAALQQSTDAARANDPDDQPPAYTGLRLDSPTSGYGSATCDQCGDRADYGTTSDDRPRHGGTDAAWCHWCYVHATLAARASADRFNLALGDPAPRITHIYQDEP